MKFHIRESGHSHHKDMHLSSDLNGFYIACARIVDNKLSYYASTNEKWSNQYIHIFQDDPIVSQQRTQNPKLSLTSWDLNTPTSNQCNFQRRRAQTTGADFGLTSYRGIINNDGKTVFEFFAIGTKEREQQNKILNNQFTYEAFRKIVHAFNN